MIKKLTLPLVGVILLLLCSCTPPDQKAKIYVVGVLNYSQAAEPAFNGFKEAMAEMGYVEGKTVRYLYQGPIRNKDKLMEEAKRQIKSGIDLIFSMSTPATLVAKKITAETSIPVVFGPVSNPVESGIVKSLKQPGENITGVTFRYQEPKRLKLLQELVPTAKNISFPYNPFDKSPKMNLQRLQPIAEKLNLTLIAQPLRNNEQIDQYLANIPPDIDAIYMPTDSLMASRSKDFAATAIQLKLPLTTPQQEGVTAGALFSFGMSLNSLGHQAARLVDQIFHGVPPAHLPVEITEFETTINRDTAKRIGITVSDSLLRRAVIIKEQ